MYVIMYHYIRDLEKSRYPKIKGLPLDYFRRQLEFLFSQGFSFVSLDDVVENREISEKSVLLTFDDGYIDHYLNVFPLLDLYGIPAVFSMPGKIIRESKVLDVNKIHFILASADVLAIREKLLQKMDYYRGSEFSYPSNMELYEKLAEPSRFDNKDTIFVKRILQVELPEKLRNIITDELFKEFVTDREESFVLELYMSLDQVKAMRRHGMTFGIHGYDHYWMNRLDEKSLRQDLASALDVFDGIVDSSNWTNCYPYGSCNDDVIRVSREMGATSGLTTEVAAYKPACSAAGGGYNVYKIPRLDTNDFPPKSDRYMEIKKIGAAR